MKNTKVFPVIHYLTHGLALEQVELSKELGADGAFLISHRGCDDDVVITARTVKEMYPDFCIGINLLSSSPVHAVGRAHAIGLDMVWADDMGVSSKGLTEMGKTLSSIAANTPEVKLFASVAFKYQPVDLNPVLAAELATKAGFIPTTSGEATGHAPDVAKIASMSSVAANGLAVASGMTPDNIGSYAPYLKYVLVATGIGADEYRIDPSKLKKFLAQVA